MLLLIVIILVVLVLVWSWSLKPIYCLSLEEFLAKINRLGQCFIVDDRRVDLGYPLMWSTDIGNLYLINKPIWTIEDVNLKAQTIRGTVVEDDEFKQSFIFTLIDDNNASIERDDGSKVNYRYLEYCTAY